MDKAAAELPEQQILDVWIELFDPGELPEQENDSLGLYPEIRAAEARFIPAHLRQIMEKTGYWGAVRVVPRDTIGAEVLVGGKIIESDGESLEIEITARDATGKIWYTRTYQGHADEQEGQIRDESEDSFEHVYYAIANDLAEFRLSLDGDFQLIDTLNGYYENFYRELEIPYEEWRKARNIEAEALREAKSKAAIEKHLGHWLF
ncbi:MAG: hypothetical protein P8Y12_05975 [Gammaproteobacteria bacterium]